MSGKHLVICFLFLINILSLEGRQQDTLNIKEIEISALKSPEIYSGLSRIVTTYDSKTIRQMPADNLHDILEYVTSLDIRQRGSQGVQADISMRGGSFEQVLILLNGVRINDPQTGHHNLNIPVNTSDIERIEILEGPGSRIYGPNSFSGAVNIITRKPEGTSVTGAVSGGGYGYIDLYASGSFDAGRIKNLISIGNRSSDGFTENTDFRLSNVFYRGMSVTGIGAFDIQAGYMNKGFGASNFYSSLYPDQYEQVKTSFTNLTFSSGKNIKYNQSVYWKRNTDRFELFRYEAASWYQGHNYHVTDIYGTSAAVSVPHALGNAYLGTEWRTERIMSSVLGEKMDAPEPVRNEDNAFYNYFKERRQINLTAGNSFIINNFAVSAGILLSHNSIPGWKIYGGLDMSLQLNNYLNWFASWNQSMRVPTYTEMYYNGPVNRGNALLEPEEAGTIESGFKVKREAWQGHVVAFRRDGKNLIDWVRKEDELLWESRNITRLNTNGIEVEFIWRRPSGMSLPVTQLRLGYSYLDITGKSEDYISAYLLDYLRHKVVAGITIPVYNPAAIVLLASYKDRAGSYTDFASGNESPYDPFMLIDLGTTYSITGALDLSIEVNNLFNIQYTDIGNVPVPGRWIKGRIILDLPVKP